MSVFAPFTEVQLQQLAMAKARGFSWTMMATCLEMPLEVVERVPWTHEKPWLRALAKAERLVAREAMAEAINFLRRDVVEGEPKLRPTIVNSLTRVLKLQQEFAPPRRRPVTHPASNIVPTTAPNMAPNVTPAAPTPSAPSPAPTPTPAPNPQPTLLPRPSLTETASAALGLILLVGVLFMGCWNRQRSSQTDDGTAEPVARWEMPWEARTVAVSETRPTVRDVRTPPPWVREPERPWHDDT